MENMDSDSDEVKWNMKKRNDKLDEIRKKFPELNKALNIVQLYIKITTVWTSDDDIDEAFSELEEILSDSGDEDSDGRDNAERFIADMKKAGIDYEEYHGRYFYEGPAVRTKEDGFPTKEDVIRATKVKLQWDNMGFDWIVYPVLN